MAKYCVRCGRKNPNNVSVCNGCGTPLAGNSVEPELFTNIELEESSILPEQQVEQLNNREVENTEIQIQDKDKINMSEVFLDDTCFAASDALFKDGIIEEKECGTDFMYILEEKAKFSTTEYRVLNSSGDNRMIPCQKIKFNDKDALFYMTGELKSFDICIPAIDGNRFLHLISDLFMQIDKLKSYGFLTDAALDVRVNRIFVDPHMDRIYLTYVPLNQRFYPDVMYLERDLRTNLVYIIKHMKNIQNNNVFDICRMLEDTSCSLEMILSVIRRMCSTSTNTGL